MGLIVRPDAATTFFNMLPDPPATNLWDCINKPVIDPAIPDVTKFAYEDFGSGLGECTILVDNSAKPHLAISKVSCHIYYSELGVGSGTVQVFLWLGDTRPFPFGYLTAKDVFVGMGYEWRSYTIEVGTLDYNGNITPPIDWNNLFLYVDMLMMDSDPDYIGVAALYWDIEFANGTVIRNLRHRHARR
jgi:hypothetical protein